MNVFIEQGSGHEVNTDVFVMGYFTNQQQPGGCFEALNEQMDGELAHLVANERIHSSYEHLQSVLTLGKIKAKELLFVGLGSAEDWELARARNCVGRAARICESAKAKKVTFCLSSFSADGIKPADLAHVISESYSLSAYKVHTWKSDDNKNESLEQLSVCLSDALNDETILQGLQQGVIYGQGTCLARELVNTPSNLLTPRILAEKAKEIANKRGLRIDVLDELVLAEKKMGALLAVAQGAVEPPRMIVLKYQGLPEWKDVIGFVGKGITFDTGGISLKQAQKMDEMIMDMAGSAAVLGAMDIIGQLKPACNVVAVIPATENMPSGNALKPGDVITSYSGKTIEVKNTDAEGRLVLADGVSYARELGAEKLVDVATLTGAVLIALGDCTTGAVTNDENWMIDVLEAAQKTDELMWRLPEFEPYKKMVRSSLVADLNNAPGRLAGSITAGLFIGEFAEDTPWVHLDIAGTAWADKQTTMTRKGGTGAMVRTLAELAISSSS